MWAVLDHSLEQKQELAQGRLGFLVVLFILLVAAEFMSRKTYRDNIVAVLLLVLWAI